jgi:hypothetical protein
MLGGNKIKHYYVSHAKALTDSKPVEEMIVEYVKKETGEDVVIETRKVNNAYGIGVAAVQEAKDVLENLPKVKKQLEKLEVKSVLHQYNRQDPWYKYLLNPIAYVWNWFAVKINAKWSNAQWEELGGFPKTKLGPRGLFALRDRIKSIPLMPIAGWRRCVTPCHYLSISFDESNRGKAVEILQNDLKILADKKLIVGHLAKPFQLQLADVTGADELSYVLACFLFIDDHRLKKLLGKKDQEYWTEISKNDPLNRLLGLRTETGEGCVGNSELRKEYLIEEVNIFEHERQEHWDAYLKSYEEQQEAIKKNNETVKKRMGK